MNLTTRIAILKRAEHYLQSAGYDSFSFRTIAADLGIKSASVHYHFASREALGSALLGMYLQKFERWAAARPVNGSPRSDLREWFSYWSSLCVDGAICPGGSFSAELTALPRSVRESVAALQSAERQWLVSVLRRGRADKVFRREGRVLDQANLILATLQGGVQLARVTRDVTTFSGVLRQLQLSLQVRKSA